MAYVLLDTEIRGLEELRKQDDLRAPGCGAAHQALGAGDVLIRIPIAGHLDGRDRQRPRRLSKVLWLVGHGTPASRMRANPAARFYARNPRKRLALGRPQVWLLRCARERST